MHGRSRVLATEKAPEISLRGRGLPVAFRGGAGSVVQVVDHVDDDTGGEGDEQDVAVDAYPLVAVGRGIQAIRMPVVDDVRARVPRERQAIAADPDARVEAVRTVIVAAMIVVAMTREVAAVEVPEQARVVV